MWLVSDITVIYHVDGRILVNCKAKLFKNSKKVASSLAMGAGLGASPAAPSLLLLGSRPISSMRRLAGVNLVRSRKS
jgi:hypothetical protein